MFIILFIILAASSSAYSQLLFEPITPTYNNMDLILPKGFTYQILFQEGKDTVYNSDGSHALSKGKHDFFCYLPDKTNSNKGIAYVGHEDYLNNKILGDGGGGTIFDLEFQNNKWNVVGKLRNVDFTTVGGTAINCGGFLTEFGTILTTEEILPISNKDINKNDKYITDTSDYNGKPRWQNFGWMVEVDPVSAKATKKLYKMGRYDHEDAQVMPDGKTVYLTDDKSPCVWFKFIADEVGKFDEGQLFAFAEEKNGKGKWIKLPMEYESLIIIRDVAIKMGATLYNRFEWIELIGDKLYITETGIDKSNWTAHINNGGKVANHLINKIDKDGVLIDFYGRVLEFNTLSDEMNVYLEGEILPEKLITFSNPDGLAQVTYSGTTYLVIHEDIGGVSMGRVGRLNLDKDERYNEIYFLDMSIKNPKLDDLLLFAAAPRGCETTGGFFSPDGSTFFFNIQEPDKNNLPPFNRSTTVAVRGFKKSEK